MLNKNILSDLFKHMEWADAEMWSAIKASPDACNDDKILSNLRHLHTVQKSFLHVWSGTPANFDELKTFDSDQLLATVKPYYKNLMTHLATVTDEQLIDTVTLPWESMVEKYIGKKVVSTTKGETALQVAFHTTHHRAQISARLREIGASPKTVDYILWLWLGRPEANWA